MALPLANASDSSGPGDRFTVCQIQFEMPEEWTHLPCIQNSTCDFSMLQPCRHSHDSVPKLWLSSTEIQLMFPEVDVLVAAARGSAQIKNCTKQARQAAFAPESWRCSDQISKSMEAFLAASLFLAPR